MITSKTKLTGVIGYPLEKTLSPAIQNAAFEAAGLDWAYLPLPVDPKNLQIAIKGLQSLGFVGINVTMPHKEAVIKLVDEISAYAKLAGAINTLHFVDSKIIGDNTDGEGFLHALEKDGDFQPAGREAVILGAGGAAHSIAVKLVQSNMKSITIVNRTLEKAQQLAQYLKSNFKECNFQASSFNGDLPKIIDSTDLVINSTSVGWEGDLVIDPKMLHTGHLVSDLVYVPTETALLQAAKAQGARILPGKLMLLYQGAASWQIWTGNQAPLEAMRKALDKSLSEYS